MSVKTAMMKFMFRIMGLPTCEEVDGFAYDYLDGKLDTKLVAMVERHLKYCKSCQKFIESYRLIVVQAKPFDPPPLEPEFKEKMFEFLRQHRKEVRD